MTQLRELSRGNIRLAAATCFAFATLAHGYGPPPGVFPGGPPFGYPGSGGSGNGGSGTGGGNGNGGNGFGGGANGDNGFPGSAFAGFDISAATNLRNIHGILCALAVVILFPIGSILMRILPGRLALWVHGIFQLLALGVYIAGAGVGIYLITVVQIPFGGGNLLTNDTTKYHPIIGLVTLVTLLPQPILGLIHHSRFKRLQRRQVWSYLHIFNGRIGVTVGIINGALGLNLAAASAYNKKVYIIVAAVMWSLWMLVALWSEIRRMRWNRRQLAAAKAAPAPVMAGAKDIPRDSRRSDSRSGHSDGSGHSARSGGSRRRSISPPRRSGDGPPRL